jgi:uncharacterized membrane protein
MIKKISLYLMSAFYLIAGLNHFVDPASYYPLIPSYLPFPEFINIFSGIAEVTFAVGLLFLKYRKTSAWGIILMLIAFIPAHVYFIQIDSCIPDGLCMPKWGGWVRLIVVHPILIGWAWIYTKTT